MIAEERHINIDEIKPVLTYRKSVSCILNCLKLATIPFLQAYKSIVTVSLNEDDLTEIFYSQVQFIIRERNYPFNIGNQERDLTKQSKGIPDLFFYANRLGKPPVSIFSIECKRLPEPDKKRGKEYVIGNNNNGGIERFKTEKHGKELCECGMLGFVEKENFDYWQQKINSWIIELSINNTDWHSSEILNIIEQTTDFMQLNSIAHRLNSTLTLYHLWITLEN